MNFCQQNFLLPDAFAAEATWKQECAISEKKTFRTDAVKGGGPPLGYLDRPPPPGAGLDRDPAETQPVKTYGISKVKTSLQGSGDYVRVWVSVRTLHKNLRFRIAAKRTACSASHGSSFSAYVARHDYILTLSTGSRSQLISERFSRMISARRSMSA
jgi:hypothetical protein